jgi:hypothetical protein
MQMAQVSGQVLPFSGGRRPRVTAPRSVAVKSEALPHASGACSEHRQRVLDAVHDALSAALTADAALCHLRLRQTLALSAGRPQVAWVACRELLRVLRVDIVARHLLACDKRRRLQREMQEVAARLRQIAAPEPV